MEHNYAQFVSYNLKFELKFWKNYNVIEKLILMTIIVGIII